MHGHDDGSTHDDKCPNRCMANNHNINTESDHKNAGKHEYRKKNINNNMQKL